MTHIYVCEKKVCCFLYFFLKNFKSSKLAKNRFFKAKYLFWGHKFDWTPISSQVEKVHTENTICTC